MARTSTLAALALTLPAAATLAQPQFIVDPIEAPEGFALYPSAINDSGVVVGWWYGSPATNRQPFIYSQATGYNLLPKPAGLQFSVPMDVNNDGVIVGFACPTWSDTTNPRGWRLHNGVFSLFPTGSHAVGINASGLIVGSSCVDDFDGSMDCVFTSTQAPSIATTPAVAGYSGAMDRPIIVNDLGQTAYRTGATTAVFRDTDGTLTPLPPPPAGWTGISVEGINNAGQVLARWTRSTSHPLRWYSRGFVWSAAIGAREFGINAFSNRPKAINNHGQVIVESGGHDQAFFDTWLWSAEGGLVNLDDKTDYGVNLVLTDLYDINDAGQILAGGDTISPPAGIYVVLNPTNSPAPLCEADLGATGGASSPDGVLDNNDFIVFIDLFFAQAAAADFASTGGVPGADGAFDNNDFVVFIDRFFAGCG